MAKHYVGLDVSQKETFVCIVDDKGQVVHEGRVNTKPFDIEQYLKKRSDCIEKIGFEVGALSPWLYTHLVQAGFTVLVLESFHAYRALSMRRNKTDKNDAKGLAELVRMGEDWLKVVHLKSQASQEARTLLSTRAHLVGMRVDIENRVCGMLKPFGFLVARGNVCAETFRDRVYTALAKATDAGIDLASTITPLLDVQEDMAFKIKGYDKRINELVGSNPVCKRFMTVPGVGPITALTYYTAIDDPHRFKNADDIGAYFGLTPRQFQSGESDYMGRISKRGDQMARLALVQSATVLLTSSRRWCKLKAWGLRLAKRVGFNKAKVAVARKLAILLHRMWVNEKDFIWTRQPVAEKAAA